VLPALGGIGFGVVWVVAPNGVDFLAVFVFGDPPGYVSLEVSVICVYFALEAFGQSGFEGFAFEFRPVCFGFRNEGVDEADLSAVPRAGEPAGVDGHSAVIVKVNWQDDEMFFEDFMDVFFEQVVWVCGADNGSGEAFKVFIGGLGDLFVPEVVSFVPANECPDVVPVSRGFWVWVGDEFDYAVPIGGFLESVFHGLSKGGHGSLELIRVFTGTGRWFLTFWGLYFEFEDFCVYKFSVLWVDFNIIVESFDGGFRCDVFFECYVE